MGVSGAPAVPRRRAACRFFSGGGAPDMAPAPAPAPEFPEPAKAQEPRPVPETEGAGEAPGSPYMEALREALAADSPEAWERFNAESARLEAEERRRFAERARADGPAPPPPAPEVRTAPPPPARRIRYECRLVRESREAYARASPELRADLDGLFSVPGVFRLERNAWSGAAGAWTKGGDPCAAGNAYLAAHAGLVPWVLGLKARCYQPSEAWAQYFSPEELAALGELSPGAEPAPLPSGAPEGSVGAGDGGEEGRNGEGKGL